jgi:hypothetical protein
MLLMGTRPLARLVRRGGEPLECLGGRDELDAIVEPDGYKIARSLVANKSLLNGLVQRLPDRGCKLTGLKHGFNHVADSAKSDHSWGSAMTGRDDPVPPVATKAAGPGPELSKTVQRETIGEYRRRKLWTPRR